MQQLFTPDKTCDFDVIAPGDRSDWDASASHPTATAAFIDVCKRHAAHGFDVGAIAHRQRDRLIGGAALFTYDFRLDMPLGPSLQKVGDWLMRIAPRLIRVPLLCLGSPHSDTCAFVIDRSLSPAARRRAIAGIIDESLALAAERSADIVAIKDLAGPIAAEASEVLGRRGFSRIESLPLAVLDLPFTSLDEYLSRLSPKMRSDLRRKQRQAKGVELSLHESGDGLHDVLDRLYAETRMRSKADYDEFDALPNGFVPALMAAMGPAAKLAITRVDGEIAGFNLFLTHRNRAVAYKIGLSDRLARRHNLYFMNWLWMVEHCIANGITQLEMGQTTYALKTRLGCRLEPSSIFVRHRSPIWNRVIQLAAPRISFARMDPDLREASAAA